MYICIHMYFQFRDWSDTNSQRGFLSGAALAEEFVFVIPKERVNGILFSAIFLRNLLCGEGLEREN